MNFENIRLSERSQAEEAAYYLIPFIWNVQNKKFIEIELGARDCGKRRWGVTANGWASLWGGVGGIMKTFWKKIEIIAAQLYERAKNHWIVHFKWWFLLYASYPFSSVAQLCLTLYNPVGCSTPGLPVHHQLPEFTQTHVHWLGDAIQPSHPLSSPSPPTFNLSQH